MIVKNIWSAPALEWALEVLMINLACVQASVAYIQAGYKETERQANLYKYDFQALRQVYRNHE